LAENSEGMRPFARSRHIWDYRIRVPGCGRMNYVAPNVE